MNTLKNMEDHFQRPGMLVALKSENWDLTNFRPKENEVIQFLMEHNKQSHVFDQSQLRKENHALYYFNKEDSALVLDKVAKNRKIKLNDFLLETLCRAAKKLEINEKILHIDLQKIKTHNKDESPQDSLNESTIIAYDLGKLHRRKLDSNIQLSMIPPLFESKLSVSFTVFADKLSLAVNSQGDERYLLLELWIREINFELFK